MNNELDEYLWGKSDPYKHLSHHMLDAGACAFVYLSSSSSTGVVAKLANLLGCPVHSVILLISYLSSLHDLGKASPYFVRSAQERFSLIPEEMKRKYFPRKEGLKFRHERESAWAARRIWKTAGAFDPRTWDTLSSVLGLHHQGKSEDAGFDDDLPAWDAAQDRLEARMRALFCPALPNLSISHHDALGAYLVGLVVLCDWVASSRAFDDLPGEADDGAYLTMAKERAERTLRSYGLTSDVPFPRVERFSALWPEIPVSGMRPVQIACTRAAEVSARLTIIEAPMGEGKSEAALYAAARLCTQRNLQGIYMAMPTAATSNQMYTRVRKMLDGLGGSHDVRLLHSLAWLLDEQSPGPGEFHLDVATDGDAQSAARWLAPLRRGLLSENAVGTVDQAMAAVLYRKYGLLRLTGLMGKVLMIDEIHAYDVYMSEIIERLLQWCDALGIPVILLSATLQRAQKERYLACFGVRAQAISGAYPLVTQVDEAGKLMEIPVNGAFMRSRFLFRTLPIMDDSQAITRRAVERVVGGGCLCVMLNTVKKAQAVYRAIKELGFKDVFLFHARFLNERRAEIEKKCVRLFGKNAGDERPKRAILVCTQVVEQSLDVDFDGMMTELAPIDLLLQRAGRVHRHRERVRPAGFEEPFIEVLAPGDPAIPPDKRYGDAGYVYDPYILAGTEALLAVTTEIRVPDDVRGCIEKVYAGLSEDRIEEFIKKQTKEEMMKVSAEAAAFPPPRADRFFGAQSVVSGKFDRPDEDGGFRIVKGAATRYGADSVRVAFLDDALFSAAGREGLSRGEEIEISKKTLSLALTILPKDVILHTEDRESRVKIYKIKTGHLNGCLAVRTEDGIARIGDRVLRVDDELGVWTEE